MNIPVHIAKKLRAEGMAWRDVAQEIAWATGRRFSFDSIQNAVYANRRKTLRLPRSLGLDRDMTQDSIIIALWNLGFDTFDIAKKIGAHESVVANRLSFLRGDTSHERRHGAANADMGRA